ncbi:MAG: carboxypeptidase-like regulatory domain-containing protein [Thermoanaerobaculia bacterium]|nr:carboxypeptidase-like regulatory domain-containing protein [Thermoanaerobaculia bacterium]
MRSGFFFVFLFAIQTAFSQHIFRGKVLDAETRAPLAGVLVMIKNAGTGTVSDARGQFILSAGEAPDTIRFLYYGYLELDSSLTTGHYHTIYLKAKTGREQWGIPPENTANAVLRPTLIQPAAYDDPAHLLQGGVSGLLMARGGSNPNENYTLRVRGLSGALLSDPLIWIDGMPGGSLSMLNPEDISEMTVIQEAASTARFGAAAQAGVVSVRTQPYRLTDWGWQLDYRTQLSLAQVLRPVKPLNAEEFLAQGGDDMMPGNESTYWPDQITSNAFSQFHHLALGYSDRKVQCRGSFGFQDRDGILLYSGYKQYRGMADATYSFWDDRIRLRGQWLGHLRQANLSVPAAFHYAVNFNPTFSIRSSDSIYQQFGGYTQFPPASFNFYNPVALLEQTKNLAETHGWRVMLRADIKLLRHLTLSGGWSQLQQQYGFGEYNMPESFYRDWLGKGYVNMGIDNSANGYWEGLLRYQTSAAKHRFSLETGVLGQRRRLDGVQFFGGDIVPRYPEIRGVRDILQLYIAHKGPGTVGYMHYDSIFENRGLLIEATHEYDERWQFTAGVRGLQWQYGGVHFPATLLPYFRGAFNVLGGKNSLHGKSLILRASWGRSADAYVPYPTKPAHWNDKKEFGLGLDAGGRRWRFSANWFWNHAHSFYQYVPNPMLRSLDIKNRGWYYALSGALVQRPRFDWQSDLHISAVNTRYDNYLGPARELNSYSHFGYAGSSWGVIRTLQKTQIIGGVTGYIDRNGDNIYNEEDMFVQGNGVPSLWLGWNNALRWKQWTLNINCRYTRGHVLLHEYRVLYEVNPEFSINNSIQTRYYNPRQIFGGNISNEHVEKAGFFRCDGLQFTYDVLPGYSGGRRFSWQIFAGVQNAFTITRYTGNDPEVRLVAPPADPRYISSQPNPRAPGIDRAGSYWLERAFYAGVRLSVNGRRTLVCDSPVSQPE